MTAAIRAGSRRFSRACWRMMSSWRSGSVISRKALLSGPRDTITATAASASNAARPSSRSRPRRTATLELRVRVRVMAKLVRLEQLVHDRVGRERGCPELLQCTQGLRLAGPDPARQSHEWDPGCHLGLARALVSGRLAVIRGRLAVIRGRLALGRRLRLFLV